ncbi:hyaluronidase-3 isoform X2 [Colius striatus]|nr:hyaluronidase-3 isoform X2 [Colius striatus]XP_061864700.1 hyaluronidase-3 isoform X2 [Colius striatus]
MVLALWVCLALGTAGGESPAPEPLAGGQPFAVVWNVPAGRCQRRFGVGLPLGDYGIVENRDGRFTGQNVTIFYKNKFGLYPYLSQHGVPRNGGIPQRVPLGAHLARAAQDIRHLLRPAFRGLAVLDWEEWRPLWARNWGAKRVYRAASEQWVRARHGLLPARRRLRLAQREFERAAQALMEETLLLGRGLRPAGLWGFYRFPDCFNSNWAKEANYTGQCRPAEVRRNDRLGWLWASSAALYPSIYLPPALPPALRRRYVHHRLREALRVAAFGARSLLPVVAYSRLSFRRSPRFLEPVSAVGTGLGMGLGPGPPSPVTSLSRQADLVHTIGESAALGAAGLVLWGDMSYSRSAVSAAPGHVGMVRMGQPQRLCPLGRDSQGGPRCQGRFSPVLSSQESCASLRHYLVTTLGPYVANVTAAARECSYGQCHGHGRCVRRQPHDLGSLLHLGPGTGPKASFRCHCYRGWAGEDCARRVQPSPATSCLAPTHSLYGQNDLPPSDTCLPQGTWGW